MYAFFVLGIVPGTNFQITFQVWLDCLLTVIEAAGLLWLYQQRCLDELQQLVPVVLSATAGFCQAACHRLLTQGKVRGKTFLLHQIDSWRSL